jgi:glycosyltransferase involved in cell wall biosynthesis
MLIINWFSPTPPAKTEIANYTASLLPALKLHAEVELWSPTDDKFPKLSRFGNQVLDSDILQLPGTGSEEINVYNIGNNWPFHALIWRLSQIVPGVVILHDWKLQHFFTRELLQETRQSLRYERVMSELYGAAGLELAHQVQKGEINQDDLGEVAPLTELAQQNCLGVVCHDPALKAHLMQNSELPILCTPLASRHTLTDRSRIASEPFRLILFGYIGPNRRLAEILTALSKLKHSKNFRLDVMGEIWDLPLIRRRIAECGLESRVKIHGFVSDPFLEQAVAEADLAFNLRYPSMGEVSATQLFLWSRGVPSFVTDVGWYSGLPSDTVVHIRPESESEDLSNHLTAFFRDPNDYRQIGLNGQRRFPLHSEEIYARNVVCFCQELLPWKAWHKAKNEAVQLGRTLANQDIHPDAIPLVARRMAEEIFSHAILSRE